VVSFTLSLNVALCTFAYGLSCLQILVVCFCLLAMNTVVASCWMSRGDIESSMFLLLHARTHRKQKKKKKKKKKNLHLCTRMVVVTRRFVTYGIRAGTTRDLGFTTGSVDMMVLIILLLIELFVLCAGHHG
jgi:threonine/homoserine/homoserine lactone efflux protein